MKDDELVFYVEQLTARTVCLVYNPATIDAIKKFYFGEPKYRSPITWGIIRRLERGWSDARRRCEIRITRTSLDNIDRFFWHIIFLTAGETECPTLVRLVVDAHRRLKAFADLAIVDLIGSIGLVQL